MVFFFMIFLKEGRGVRVITNLVSVRIAFFYLSVRISNRITYKFIPTFTPSSLFTSFYTKFYSIKVFRPFTSRFAGLIDSCKKLGF